MSIYYSFIVRPSNIMDETSAKKVYAVAQSKKTLTLRAIAQHLASHQSPYSEGTIMGLLTDAVKCITENLLEGNRVDMWDLGTFYVTLSCKGASSSEEFTTSLIKRVNLRWKTSGRMYAELQQASFERVPTIELTEDAKKTMAERADVKMGVSDTSGGDTSGEGGSGDDPGDGGGGSVEE